MHHFLRLFSFSLLLLGSAAHAQAPADALVRPENLRQLTPHVWLIPDGDAPLVPNVGIVVGKRAMLVVNTGLGPRNGAAVYQAARKLGGARKLYVVTNDFRAQNDLGTQGFPAGAVMLRSAAEDKNIAQYGEGELHGAALRSQAAGDLLADVRYRATNTGFAQDMMLDLGGVTVHLHALGESHGFGNVAVWVEGERVLFSGTLVMRAQPVFGFGQPQMGRWLEDLDQLENLHPAVIVPGHGAAGGTELIQGYRDYFAEIRQRALEEKAKGRSPMQAADIIADDMADHYADKNRTTLAVLAFLLPPPRVLTPEEKAARENVIERALVATTPEWISLVAARVRAKLPRAALEGVPAQAHAVFDVTLAPDGGVREAQLLQSSGYPVYDSATLQAITAASPLPLPLNGARMPRKVRLDFMPR